MKKLLKKIQWKILYVITYYQITHGRWAFFYGPYSKPERKQIANKLINDYLNDTDL